MQAILIAGTHSGCGKTTVTLGILAALRIKGLTVQPFKAGPDFIDSGLHRLAVDRPSRNLDLWMCGPEYVTDCFKRYASSADIAVIEGVMGMHDGEFSSADLARGLGAPVLLVVDAYGMAESAGAVVKGFVEFGVKDNKQNPSSALQFAGVIFNRVASESHYKRLKDSVQGLPVLGYLPRELDFEIPHRHLGLTIAEENPLTAENIDKLADTVLEHVDVDALIRSAVVGIVQDKKDIYCEGAPCTRVDTRKRWAQAKDAKDNGRFKIAVAYDKAFCFYYEDNLDLLREAGCEIVLFSPLTDSAIPDAVDAVYVGGGYPELHAGALSRNESMIASVRKWSQAGKPMYAECGGLMYLSQGIRDFENRFYAMAGLFPFETGMLRKPRLAYREIALIERCILGSAEDLLRGHEFHYSEILQTEPQKCKEEESCIYKVRDKNGREGQPEGHRIRNTLASYIHVHFGSNPNTARRFAKFSKGEHIG